MTCSKFCSLKASRNQISDLDGFFNFSLSSSSKDLMTFRAARWYFYYSLTFPCISSLCHECRMRKTCSFKLESKANLHRDEKMVYFLLCNFAGRYDVLQNFFLAAVIRLLIVTIWLQKIMFSTRWISYSCSPTHTHNCSHEAIIIFLYSLDKRVVHDFRACLTDRYKSLIEHHSWNW